MDFNLYVAKFKSFIFVTDDREDQEFLIRRIYTEGH